jgi:geranylgeranyl pyrophosphate synthase
MQDDLLDVAGQSAVTGKPRGIDLRDGNPSLPVVLTLARDPEFRALFARRGVSQGDIEEGLARIARADVLGIVADRARAELDAALAAIARLPASPCRDALVDLARGMDDRTA